ncbi:MAG: hypothetical protein P8K10_03480 [Crocinitomicaceae bacterium]|nr:hypothetical protein [Crocinitomicaceae bacterium]
MKKIFPLIFLGLFLNSCNSYLGKKLSKKSAEDIDVEKIEDACDCVEAFEIISANFLDIFGNKTREEMNELSDDKKEMLQKKVDPLFEKRDEVNQHCRKFGISYKRFTNGQECSSYKGLSKNSNKLKEQGFK